MDDARPQARLAGKRSANPLLIGCKAPEWSHFWRPTRLVDDNKLVACTAAPRRET
jgi:hypothetical protein